MNKKIELFLKDEFKFLNILNNVIIKEDEEIQVDDVIMESVFNQIEIDKDFVFDISKKVINSFDDTVLKFADIYNDLETLASKNYVFIDIKKDSIEEFMNSNIGLDLQSLYSLWPFREQFIAKSSLLEFKLVLMNLSFLIATVADIENDFDDFDKEHSRIFNKLNSNFDIYIKDYKRKKELPDYVIRYIFSKLEAEFNDLSPYVLNLTTGIFCSRLGIFESYDDVKKHRSFTSQKKFLHDNVYTSLNRTD